MEKTRSIRNTEKEKKRKIQQEKADVEKTMEDNTKQKIEITATVYIQCAMVLCT